MENPAPTNHPADFIDRALCMTGFLATMIGESQGGSCLTGKDMEGFSHILSHIEDNLKQALPRL